MASEHSPLKCESRTMNPSTLWYTRCPVPTAFGIAVERGFLDAELARDGIVARSLASSTDNQVRQSHFHHSQPNSFRHGGNGPPLVTRSRGGRVKLIGLSWNDSIKPMLVMPDSGIASVRALAGRKVSLPIRAGDSIDFWKASSLRGTELALAQEGMTMDDVAMTPVSTNRTFMDGATASTAQTATLWGAHCMLGHQREEAFALVRGEVDALYSQGAIAAVVMGFTGAVAIADAASSPDLAGRVNNDAPLALTVSEDLLAEQPELVARCVAAVLRAAAWASANEREAKRVIAADTGLPEELVDAAFPQDVHRQLEVDLRPEWVEALRVQHDHLLRHGFLAAPVAFEDFVDHGPLRRAREILAGEAAVPL